MHAVLRPWLECLDAEEQEQLINWLGRIQAHLAATAGSGSEHRAGILGPLMADGNFVQQVRLDVLQEASRTGHVPDADGVASRLSCPVGDVLEAFRQLAEGHVYVLEPGNPARLRMANPFSAVPTAFRVEVRGRQYFGNCVWDALGVVSLLGGEGRVTTPCPDCQEPLVLEVSGRQLAPLEAVVHFAVPARRWWEDIIHT